MLINGVKTVFEIDMGASTTIINESEYQIERLFQNPGMKTNLQVGFQDQFVLKFKYYHCYQYYWAIIIIKNTCIGGFKLSRHHYACLNLYLLT